MKDAPTEMEATQRLGLQRYCKYIITDIDLGLVFVHFLKGDVQAVHQHYCMGKDEFSSVLVSGGIFRMQYTGEGEGGGRVRQSGG